MSRGSGDRGLVRRPSVAADVDREIESHLAMRAAELVEQGWDPVEAREEALRLFGDRESLAARCERISNSHRRAVGRMMTMEAIWQDIRYGARSLARSPSFALVTILTLALGIGANSAVFSVVNGVMLKPLPFDDPHELVWITEISNRGGSMSVAGANFTDWKERSNDFDGIVAFGRAATTVLGGVDPTQANVATVSNDLWSVFGVEPFRGRLTTPDDHHQAAAPVVVVSRRFWENELAGADHEGVVLEVVGVQARVAGIVDGFDYPGDIDIWAPMELLGLSDSRSAHNWRVVARLADGVTPALATERLSVLTRQLVDAEQGEDPDYLATGVMVVPLQDEVVGEARSPLLLLLSAAVLVLLVACTNLASTFLARGSSRTGELAVRMSLGAPKGRVVRQLLTESFVVAAFGGLAGVLLAAGALRILRSVGAGSVPRIEEIALDGTVLAYTALLTVFTTVLFGLLPALRLTGRGSGSALREGSRGNAVSGKAGVWKLLVAAEVGMALVLLVSAGLLVRTSSELLGEDVGADVTDVATAGIALSRVKYETGADHARWYAETLAMLEERGEVRSAGVMSALPVGGGIPNGRLELDGDESSITDGGYVVASGGVFEALDIPLLGGRTFDDRDRMDTEHVAIVSRSFAEKAWPGRDPIGRQVTGGGMDNFYSDRIFARVVGVVGDVRYSQLGRAAEAVVYFPASQRPFRLQFGGSLVAESETGDPDAVFGPLRSTIRQMDADVPIRIQPHENILRASLSSLRFVEMLFGAFAVIALVLAGVGIYGVVSYGVSRRTREMGIRLALGAETRSVLGMVVGSSMMMVVAGLFVGLIAAFGLTRLMGSMLYGVTPMDPLTIAAVVALLAGTGLISCWLPARAGTRVDPTVAMRAE